MFGFGFGLRLWFWGCFIFGFGLVLVLDFFLFGYDFGFWLVLFSIHFWFLFSGISRYHYPTFTLFLYSLLIFIKLQTHKNVRQPKLGLKKCPNWHICVFSFDDQKRQCRDWSYIYLTWTGAVMIFCRKGIGFLI